MNRTQEEAKRLTPEVCLCDTLEEGWRACPTSLCERDDHDHHRAQSGVAA